MGEQTTVLELMAQAAASTPGPSPAKPALPPAEAASPAGETLVERVERLTGELAEVGDPHARAVAEALMSALLELYGDGLERILDLIDDGAREALAGDGVVASLLLIHDLYPVPLEQRVGEALEQVRPYMESHGGDVELLSLEGGVARLRLNGSCDGCPASASTLELAIEKALMEAAPDLLGLEVEGVAEPVAPPDLPGTPLPLAPPANAGGNGNGGVPALSGWLGVQGLSALPDGAQTTVEVSGAELFVANLGGTLLAYLNACAACGARLDGGVLGGGVLGCPGCSARFDLPRAGRGVDDPGLQLDPVPLLRDGETEVKVALAS